MKVLFLVLSGILFLAAGAMTISWVAYAIHQVFWLDAGFFITVVKSFFGWLISIGLCLFGGLFCFGMSN